MSLIDRDALQDLGASAGSPAAAGIGHRFVDPGQAIAQVSEEITIIEAGVATLAPE